MKYTVIYNGKSVTRYGDTALEAIEKICDRHGWNYQLKDFDTVTGGRMWAECAVDTKRGTDWNMTILAIQKED